MPVIGYNRSAPMDDTRFPRVVSLACHDLRTPLATIYGFARTLNRMEDYDERTGRYLGMIEEASQQMTELLDELGAIARIEADRWDPARREVDTVELARVDDERVVVEGKGETIETDVDAVADALRSFAFAALRHGPVDRVRWSVSGRELVLSPVTPAAAPVVTGEEVRDLGSLVGGAVIEALGGSVALDGDTVRVLL
jgi:signal transduction histidine kinase